MKSENARDTSSLLVNLSTGETIEADPYRLREMGIPEGFTLAEDISVNEWVKALRRALN